jgi:hypothetical protein
MQNSKKELPMLVKSMKKIIHSKSAIKPFDNTTI